MTRRFLVNAFATSVAGVVLLCAISATPQTPSAIAARVFASETGMVLNTVKPDKVADFEMVMARVKDALQKSDKPERKQQAAGWRVFKAKEPGANNSVLYIFWINPAVKDADYTVSKILAEAFPSEVQDLYKKYSDAYAGGQTFVNLDLISAMGPPRTAERLIEARTQMTRLQ